MNKFWKNVMMAVVSSINPAISFFGSIVEYITSETKIQIRISILNLLNSVIPGGFVKDLTVGILIDEYRIDYLSEAVKKIVPFNNVILKCQTCDSYTHYYVINNNKIKCSNCIEKGIDSCNDDNSKLYLMEKNINKLHNNVSNTNYMIFNSFIENNMI